MYDGPVRFSRMRYVGTAVGVVGIAGGLAVVGYGALRWSGGEGLWMVTAGGSIACASIVALVMTRLALKLESNTSRLYNEARELHEALQTLSRSVTKIAENTSISEATKSIAHRDQERDALRRAIYEEVRREDYDAAFHLIDDFETRMGYREEAERLRLEIRDACTDAFRSKLKQALEHVHVLLERHEWAQAQSEIERLEKVMPNEKRIADLWRQLDDKRNAYKEQLISTWRDEATKKNIERCLLILKELDPYLSREEARELESSAREVFRERLLQLGVQFQFAVRERRWQDALTAGIQITEEFPNSRMAQEIKDRIAPLRARAGFPTDIDVTSREPSVAHSGDSTAGGI